MNYLINGLTICDHEEYFKCGECDAGFISKRDLGRHIISVHQKMKPFKFLFLGLLNSRTIREIKHWAASYGACQQH